MLNSFNCCFPNNYTAFLFRVKEGIKLIQGEDRFP